MRAIFECYGYETIQDADGLKLIANISLNVQGKLKHVKHAFKSDDEIIQFFKSIGINQIDYYRIPNSHGLCEVTADGNMDLITEWYEVEKEREEK